MEALLRVFDMLQFFETILPSVESLCSSQQDEYILWVVALLEASDITNTGQRIRNQVKIAINDTLYVRGFISYQIWFGLITSL